jgi:hypothetical protein
MQPIRLDKHGTTRFVANACVEWVVDKLDSIGYQTMNELAMDCKAAPEERQQFAQLIGYSVSGYCDLNYVDRQARLEANAAADTLDGGDPKDLIINELRKELAELRKCIRTAAVAAFDIHPDDLQ